MNSKTKLTQLYIYQITLQRGKRIRLGWNGIFKICLFFFSLNHNFAVHRAEHFARCSLLFACCSLLFTRCSSLLLVARYSFLLGRSFLLVARYFLLVARFFSVYRMLWKYSINWKRTWQKISSLVCVLFQLKRGTFSHHLLWTTARLLVTSVRLIFLVEEFFIFLFLVLLKEMRTRGESKISSCCFCV